MDRSELPIAVFDSGLGGLSVLRALRRLLPRERFVYFGDSANAPYGSRPTAEVRALTLAAFDRLAAEPGCKAMVVACNTATSAAINALRRRWADRPVIGIEPALKPAVDRHPGGSVLVMATETTLREEKFAGLMRRFSDRCTIRPLPCPGLMEFVERGELDSPALENYLHSLLDPIPTPDAVVLGCTHYPFLRPVLRRVLAEKRRCAAAENGGEGRTACPELPDGAELHGLPEILDGSDGTARETKRRLAECGLLRTTGEGETVLLNSSPDPRLQALAARLLNLPTEE